MTSPQDPYSPSGAGSSRSDGLPAWGSQPTTGSGQPTPGSGQPTEYGQPGYGQPGHGGVQDQPRQRRNGLGTAALVLGILAVLTSITVIGGVVLGLIAVVLGAVGRGRARRGEADNGGMALAGLVLGVVGALLSLALIAFGLSVLNSPEGQQLQDCLDSAGSDQAAVSQCNQEFTDSQ